MISSAYKNKLIERIRLINDEAVLKEIEVSLDKADPAAYKLSGEEKNAINIAEEQISFGKTMTSEQARSERAKWL